MSVGGSTPARLALVSRGDPLTPYLHAALAKRYSVVADLDVELGGMRRAAVGALTWRPTRMRWAGRYMKSNLGVAARSRWARRQLADIDEPFDVVFQTHALFRTDNANTVIYVDCTYREAMAGWPAWAPLRGRALTRWLREEQDTYRRAAHLFTFTARSQDALVTDYGIDPSRITVVGSGVNFHTDPRSLRHEVPAGDPNILFVGKEYDRKGVASLFDAFEKVRAEYRHVRLRIVGMRLPGPVPEGVDVLGVIDDRAMMDELYSRAGIFCLPSIFDPAPMVVLEAMAHGLPCVLSVGAAAHVRALVDDGSGGWVAPNGDSDGLAAGICTYLGDPDLAKRVGDRARDAMAADYTWDRVVDRMVPALDEVAAQRRDVNRA